MHFLNAGDIIPVIMRSSMSDSIAVAVDELTPSKLLPHAGVHAGVHAPTRATATATTTTTTSSPLLRYGSLLTLALQNSALILLMRQSRLSSAAPAPAESVAPTAVEGTPPLYLASTAVVLCELIKLLISTALLVWQEHTGGIAMGGAQRSRMLPFFPNKVRGDGGDGHGLLLLPSSTSSTLSSSTFTAAMTSTARFRRWQWTRRRVWQAVVTPDAWKLAVPGLLYAVQNK